MPHIFHNCATSYIKIDGKKIYLDDSYYTLKKKIEDNNDDFITLRKSTMTGSDKITVNRKNITEYGEVK